jgi:hypothetical protein
VTKLPNGLVVASMENNSPVFRVAAVVDAGAKYEPYENRGVTTMLRVFSNLVFLLNSIDCVSYLSYQSISEHKICESSWFDKKFGTFGSQFQVR